MCELCERKKITKWYHEDNICWIANCKTCGNPMIVLKHHGEPTEEELSHLKQISQRLFPDKKWRGIRKKIKDHWHEHFV